MNYYKRYMGDYQRDTGHLSLAAHGAFTLLLDHYYSTRKPLPASLEDIYRLCRAMTRQEQTAVRSVAEEFFPVDEDGFRHNQRADREIATWAELSEEARASGKRGAAARWAKEKANPIANPMRTPSKENSQPHTDPNAHPNGVSMALQLHSHSHSHIPDPEPRSESEVDRRGQVSKRRNEPASAAQLLAQAKNGKHAGEAESPDSSEAATLKRIVLGELSRGVSPAAIIRAMPGRGLTEEHIATIAREVTP